MKILSLTRKHHAWTQGEVIELKLSVQLILQPAQSKEEDFWEMQIRKYDISWPCFAKVTEGAMIV